MARKDKAGRATRPRLDWFKLYAADFKKGTQEMTNEEVGAYFRLLIDSWLNYPNVWIENKPRAIMAALPNTTTAQWQRISKVVLENFSIQTVEKKGKKRRALFNKRLLEEYAIAVSDGRRSTCENGQGYNSGTDVPQLPGYKEVDSQQQQQQQKDSGAQPAPGLAPLSGEGKAHVMAAEKHVRKQLAEIWQEVKNCKTLVLPPVHPAWKDQWLSIVEQVDRDELYRMFREWATEEGDARRDGNPLVDFVKAFERFNTRHATLVGAQPADESPEILAARQRSIDADVAEAVGFRKNMRPIEDAPENNDLEEFMKPETPPAEKTEMELYLEELEADTPKPNEKQ